jgi:hypothetical protein
MIKSCVEFVETKLQDFIMEFIPAKAARDFFDDPFSKRYSTDLAPKINSVTFCESIGIGASIVD